MIVNARIVKELTGTAQPPADLIDLAEWVRHNVTAPPEERSDDYYGAVRVRGVTINVHLQFMFAESTADA
jgi:hypothetical protein